MTRIIMEKRMDIPTTEIIMIMMNPTDEIVEAIVQRTTMETEMEQIQTEIITIPEGMSVRYTILVRFENSLVYEIDFARISYYSNEICIKP